MKLIDYNALRGTFGPPGNTAGLVRVELPFPMRLSWEKSKEINIALVHPYIADELIGALSDILEYYGDPMIRAFDLDMWGGAYNDRKARGSNRWSVHAWGLAVDYLPNLGGYGIPAVTPHFIVKTFKSYGFAWGGDWEYPDGMHFTAVKE